MKGLIAGSLLVLLMVCTGCKNDPQKRLEGSWFSETNDVSYYMVLGKDGAGSMNVGGVSFIFTYQADSESFTIEENTDVSTHLYSLSPNGKTLEIRNFLMSGINVTFNKQR
ncbi:MAG: hypothetical protein LBL28_05125 [Treponema sp.]|nr:hypothetical protein [Treponema sp.]